MKYPKVGWLSKVLTKKTTYIWKIHIKTEIGEMNSSTLCHIIEAKTYSWEELACTRMVWFHQCFLYSCDDEVKCVMVAKKKKKQFLLKNHIIQMSGSTLS